MIYDKKAKKLFKPFVDQYKPQDGSTTILKLITGQDNPTTTILKLITGQDNPTTTILKLITGQEPDPSCGCNFTGMGMVVLCLLASVETLWFC